MNEEKSFIDQLIEEAKLKEKKLEQAQELGFGEKHDASVKDRMAE